MTKYTHGHRPLPTSKPLTPPSKSESRFSHVCHTKSQNFRGTNTLWSKELDFFHWRNLVWLMGFWNSSGRTIPPSPFPFRITHTTSQPGGQDSQLVIPDGSAFLDTKYILQTHDSPPSHIVIKTHGWRTGPPEILAKLADPEQADTVDPNSYKFRIFIEMETGDERYRDRLNCGMWVGSGMRKGAEVVYECVLLILGWGGDFANCCSAYRVS